MLVIVAAIGYFFWGTVFNKGTLNIIADTPFTVEKLGGELLECNTLPCEMKLKSGANELIFRKEGFKSFAEEIDVKLWRTTDFNVAFEIIPLITLAEKFPQPEKEYKYELGYDKKYNKYKLTEEDQDVSLAYFNSEVLNPLIFGTKNYVIILEQKKSNKTTVYRIDIRAKTRESFDLDRSVDVQDGAVSMDGNYLLFSSKDSENLQVLNIPAKQVVPLDLNLDLSQASWTLNNSLIFATRRNFSSSTIGGKYSGNYLKFLEGDGNTLLFAAYHPDENSITELASFTFSEIFIDKVPALVIAASNGQIIYFRVDDKDYKVVLKQF